MGLKYALEWKKFFETKFVPEETVSCTVDGINFLKFGEKCIILDASVLFHAIFNESVVETWEMLYSYYKKRIISYLERSNSIEKLIVCIDNPNHVPKNKTITQEKRNGTTRLLTLEEVNLIRSKIGEGNMCHDKINLDINEIKSGILADRNLKCEIHGWIWYKIISQGLVKVVRLVLDSVKFKSIKGIFKKLPEEKIDDEAHITLDLELKIRCHELYSINISRSVGEGEIKAIYYLTKETKLTYGVLNLKEKPSITLVSRDTDILILILLCMLDNIDPETGDVPVNIFLFDGIKVWNMCMLWRWIYDWFSLPENKKYNTRNPIETLALLAIFCGTDYTDNIKDIGFGKVIKYYFKEGYKYLGSFKNSHENTSDKLPIVNEYGTNDPESYTIKTVSVIGGYNLDRTIQIDKTQFIKFVCGINKKTHGMVDNLIELENIYLRVVWVLGYWINSPKHIERHRPLDPLRWGWKMQNGKITMA